MYPTPKAESIDFLKKSIPLISGFRARLSWIRSRYVASEENMKTLQLPDSIRFKAMSTEELRGGFLLESLFIEDSLDLVYLDLDRTVIGSAVPSTAPLTLPCSDQLRATHFLAM